MHGRIDCSDNKTDLKLGDYGSVSSPNYPRNYPARLSCEWQLEVIAIFKKKPAI